MLRATVRDSGLNPGTSNFAFQTQEGKLSFSPNSVSLAPSAEITQQYHLERKTLAGPGCSFPHLLQTFFTMSPVLADLELPGWTWRASN